MMMSMLDEFEGLVTLTAQCQVVLLCSLATTGGYLFCSFVLFGDDGHTRTEMCAWTQSLVQQLR